MVDLGGQLIDLAFNVNLTLPVMEAPLLLLELQKLIWWDPAVRVHIGGYLSYSGLQHICSLGYLLVLASLLIEESVYVSPWNTLVTAMPPMAAPAWIPAQVMIKVTQSRSWLQLHLRLLSETRSQTPHACSLLLPKHGLILCIVL